jgi:hypothetical protein
MQDIYAAAWRAVDLTAEISLKPSVKEAMNFAKIVGGQENGMQTLVTGDTHLVGAALYLLEQSITCGL